MKKIIKKILWIILLNIGFFPIFVAILNGLNSAINGTTPALCQSDCEVYYGIRAFGESFFFLLTIFFPIYLISTILIFISLIKLVKQRN